MTRSPRRRGPAASWPAAVRGWPLWALPPALRGYVLAVSATGAAAIAWAAAVTPWRARDALTYGTLLGMGAVTIETIRRMSEPSGAHKDVHGVWQIAAALLLPPFYALAAPAVVFAVTQWRVRQTLAYRRVFSSAAIGLSYGAASLVFHAARPGPLLPSAGAGMTGWLATAAACAALRYAVNNVLVTVAVRLDDPAAGIGEVVGGAAGLRNDLAELCVGVLVAFAAGVSLAAVAVALPCGMLLQRSASHAQLLRASRTDAKTGLLSAVAWRQEAAVQVTRACQAGGDLAIAMIDIDHFKAVNDTYGHLAGDDVLVAVAQVLAGTLRPGDLAGRFGGEEFCVLLARSGAAEAAAVAERLRAALGEITVPAPVSDGPPPRITVSIGVAALDEGACALTDLLAAADAALYRAKDGGRNMVKVASEPCP